VKDSTEKVVKEARALEKKLKRPLLANEAKPFLQRLERLAAKEEFAQTIKQNKIKRRLRDLDIYNSTAENIALKENDTETIINAIQRAIAVECAREPPRNAKVYKAYNFGETQEEIAKRFGLSQSQVSNIIARINQRIRKRIEEITTNDC